MGEVRRFPGRASTPPGAAFQGERLRLARLFRGLSLEELGGRVAATRQYMHQLETGARMPTREMVEALAALEVAPSFFARSAMVAVAPEHCHFR